MHTTSLERVFSLLWSKKLTDQKTSEDISVKLAEMMEIKKYQKKIDSSLELSLQRT